MRPNIPHAHMVDFCVLSTSGISLTLLFYKQICVNKVRTNKFEISYIKKVKVSLFWENEGERKTCIKHVLVPGDCLKNAPIMF